MKHYIADFLPYQTYSKQHIIKNKASGLFLEMGLGKTITTLTAFHELKFDYMEVNKILVIAPKRVAENVWTAERDEWDHVQDFKMSKILGNKRERIRGLIVKADIYIINRENVAWLVAYFGVGRWPFDAVIIDESSSFKDHQSERFKALKKVRPLIKRVVLLTGTPAPNSLINLWPQLFLLDQGERLGDTITSYRDRYFYAAKQKDHIVYKYGLHEGAEKKIYKKISDICISMQSKDYIKLPEKINRTIDIYFDKATMKKYEDFEREQILAISDETEITALSAAALIGKLLQFSNGAVYDEFKQWHNIHEHKLNAVEEIIDNLNGQPLILFYWFKHDYERLLRRFKKYKPNNLKTTSDINAWNKGKIELAFLHPASAGHGLNLQHGGSNILWFGPIWSLELNQQADARLHRPGQKSTVIINRLVAKGTADEDVMKTIDVKDKGQRALIEAVKAKIIYYKKQKR